MLKQDFAKEKSRISQLSVKKLYHKSIFYIERQSSSLIWFIWWFHWKFDWFLILLRLGLFWIPFDSYLTYFGWFARYLTNDKPSLQKHKINIDLHIAECKATSLFSNGLVWTRMKILPQLLMLVTRNKPCDLKMISIKYSA